MDTIAKLSFSFIFISLLSGCGSQTYYRNINHTRNANQDTSYCRAVAIGSVQIPNMQQYQNNVSPYTPKSGTMSDQYGNIYRYQENYNTMAAAQSNMAMAQQGFNNMAISLQNSAAQFEAQGARDTIFNQCMSQLGWIQISKEEYDTRQQLQANQHLAIIQAAEQGNAQAQYRLALMYSSGDKVQQDHAKAVRWMQKSAAQGNANGQYNLGLMYSTEGGYGGLAKDDSRAVEWHKKAAEQGHPIAQDILGDAYYGGFGVTKDEKQAMEWYRKAIPGLRQAAEAGMAEAQFRLANALYGGIGVDKDERTALDWFKKAAAQGYQPAQDTLNQMKQAERP